MTDPYCGIEVPVLDEALRLNALAQAKTGLEHVRKYATGGCFADNSSSTVVLDQVADLLGRLARALGDAPTAGAHDELIQQMVAEGSEGRVFYQDNTAARCLLLEGAAALRTARQA